MNCKKYVQKSYKQYLNFMLLNVVFLKFAGIYAINKLYLVTVLHKALNDNLPSGRFIGHWSKNLRATPI